MKYKLLLLLLISANTSIVYGQKDVVFWQRIMIKHSLFKEVNMTHEIHARELSNNNSINPTLLMYRPWFTQRLNSIQTVQFSPLAVLYRNSTIGQSVEIRSSLLNEWNFKMGNWMVLNRMGFEARWWNNQPNVRVRARVGGKYQWKKNSFFITDEFLLNSNLRTNSFQHWIHGQWDVTILQKYKIQLGVQCVNENKKYKNTIIFTGLEINL